MPVLGSNPVGNDIAAHTLVPLHPLNLPLDKLLIMADANAPKSGLCAIFWSDASARAWHSLRQFSLSRSASAEALLICPGKSEDRYIKSAADPSIFILQVFAYGCSPSHCHFDADDGSD